MHNKLWILMIRNTFCKAFRALTSFKLINYLEFNTESSDNSEMFKDLFVRRCRNSQVTVTVTGNFTEQ